MAKSKEVNYEDMSLDELIEFRTGQKQEIRNLQEEYEASGDVLKQKVSDFHIDEAVKQILRAAEEGERSPQDQVREWIENGDAGQRRQANLVASNQDRLPKGE